MVNHNFENETFVYHVTTKRLASFPWRWRMRAALRGLGMGGRMLCSARGMPGILFAARCLRRHLRAKDGGAKIHQTLCKSVS